MTDRGIVRYVYTALMTVVLLAFLAVGCGDGGAAELEAQAAEYEAQIAELEQQLSDATSTTTTTAPPTQMIVGAITLNDNDLGKSGEKCWGRGGYDDMNAGADVVVRDGDGKIVGSSSLDKGLLSRGGRQCEFPFEVDVPDGLDFYTVEISHRGGLTYTHAEMEAADWIVAFTIG